MHDEAFSLKTVDVSIIILTKNGEEHLDALLQSVGEQETSCRTEIIVIDSGSRDNTLSIVDRYPVRLHCIPPEEFGHGKTRNLGAGLARGDSPSPAMT